MNDFGLLMVAGIVVAVLAICASLAASGILIGVGRVLAWLIGDDDDAD